MNDTNNTGNTDKDLFPSFAERLELHEQHKKRAALGKRTTRKKQPETVIQDAVCKMLIQQGWLVIQHKSGVMQRSHDSVPFSAYRIRNTAAASGLSDLTAHKNGRTLFVEIKTQQGRQSESQKKFQQLCTKHGMEYVVVRSVEDVLRIITR